MGPDPSLRYTFLATPDNIDILIPNSVLVGSEFENLTRSKDEVRLSLKFEVAQTVDIEKIRDLAQEACMNVPEVAAATGRQSKAFYLGPNREAHQFDLRFWVNDPRSGPGKLRSDVAYAVFKRFKEEGTVPLPVFRIETAPFPLNGLPPEAVTAG